MKTIITTSLTAATLLLAFGRDASAAQTIYDAIADFDPAAGGTNGWRYLYDATGSGSYAEMSVGLDYWGNPNLRDTTCTEAAIFGPTASADMLLTHPASVDGCNGWTTLAWEAPTDGVIDFHVAATEDAGCVGSGVDLELRNAAGELLWSQYDTSMGVSYEHEGTSSVVAGERLYLRLAHGPGGSWCDATELGFTVSHDSDADGDGVGDASDNCPDDANPGQEDADLDGVGDLCGVPNIIGQWTFEPGYETVEATGHWGDLVLGGNASVSGGQLHVHGSGTTASGWAHSPGYDGGIIRDKTLVSWVALDDLDVRAGSAMTIDNISGDNFDAIVYAERQAYRWMAGSSWFRRTQDVVGVDETALGQIVQMAISYRDLGAGLVEITICRDGEQIGQYTSANMTQWSGAGAEVIFGKRHTNGGYQPGALEARIEEARIYDGPMSCVAAGALGLNIDSDGDGTPDQGDICDGYDDAGDGDGDGTPDGCDPCFGNDADGDDDGDGICEDLDLCEGDDASGDLDGDLVCDDLDNCVATSNPDQADGDADGSGDACDDFDGDGLIDIADSCPWDANADQADSDLDGSGDVCDDDDDDDGIDDLLDNCPLVVNAAQADTDADGQGDACDGDDDADGMLDEDDLCPGTPMDVTYDDDGCSGTQRVDRSCGSCADFPNHGQYVSCVAHAAKAARDAGLLSNQERAGMVHTAAKAVCE